jgi:FAD synthase
VIALLHFTRELSLLTASEFMDALEARLLVRELWFGEDFRFGHDRGGDLPMLVERGRKSGFALHMVSRRMEDTESISSSRIRRTIMAGDVAAAIPLLGYPFVRESFDAKLGSWLGGPGRWAQAIVPPHLTLPADGVYAVVSSTGRHTVAAVTAVDDEYQLRVKDLTEGHSVTVSFIDRVTGLDDYQSDPARYEERALELLATWRPPLFVPSSHH